MKIKNNCVVAIDYKLTEKDTLLENSSGKDPLMFIHGQGHVIEGLEDALFDREVGEKFTVTIPPEKGYGKYDDSMVQIIPLDQFEANEKIVPGMQFEVQTEYGVHVVTAKEVSKDNVTIDMNPPLAGKTLTFEVEILNVREATEEDFKLCEPGNEESCCGSNSDSCHDNGSSCCSSRDKGN